MLNVRAHEVHQNDHSYVREVSEPTFNSLHKTLVWWTITRRPQSHKAGGWRLPGTVQYMQHPQCLLEELATHVRHLTRVASSMVISGVTAGASGAFIGTPAEISLIRMTSDGR